MEHENLNLLTNSELNELIKDLTSEFDKTKVEVVRQMEKLEMLEKKYNEIKTILNKRNGK